MGSSNKKQIMVGAEPFFFERGKTGCILSHGFTGSPKEVKELGIFLAKKGISTIGPLLPGHGTNVKDMIPTTKEDWYEEYTRAFRMLEENCEEIFVGGLSLGGLLTLKFASEHKAIVTEGRDQGTVAFPNADVKFFMSAQPGERARRRLAELKAKGVNESIEQIQESIEKRDKSDMERSVGPLKPADDAIIIDTTELDIEQVVDKLIGFIRKKGFLK